MDLITKGKYKDNELEIAMWFNPDEEFSAELGFNSRFRLIFVQKGTGILKLNEYLLSFAAPVVLFINDKDHIELKDSTYLSAQAVYFHPCVVNFAFNFQNIRENTDAFSPTEHYDLAWLTPFLDTDTISNRLLSVGPSSYSRTNHLFECINQELNGQTNRFWTCRTRSYLLELLIFLRRLPNVIESVELTESSEDINPVLLYIHNNYQNKITLPELAQKFNTNRTTLSEKFYDATGVSIGAYLVRKRIQVAAALIRDTNLPVMEIMHRVGFNNMSHFITAFRKYNNISPKEYRTEYTCMR